MQHKTFYEPNTLIALTILLVIGWGAAQEARCDPTGWDLVWSDDFDQLDTARWDVISTDVPTNNSLQEYLPSQVSVSDGNLVITSVRTPEDAPAGALPYRSGQVITKSSQRFGRWEVRAKLPTTRGMWPAIWLLPDVEEYRWPSGGEIDIMENRGNQPTLTSSAFHFGSNPPFSHRFHFGEQQTRVAGQLVDYSDGFHTYAVDWTPNYLRFYVDGVHHFSVHDQDVGGFLSNNTAPMELVINTAVGGDFLPNPDSSTQWPQTFEVDWVRVYEADTEPHTIDFANRSFDAGGGTLSGWSVFGNSLQDNPNVSAASEAVLHGGASLKLFGSFGADQYSGVSQGISVAGGQQVTASLDTQVLSGDSIASTGNQVLMKIEFYSEFGAKFGSAQMLGVEEITIANAATDEDVWRPHTLSAIAPAGATEARLAIVFHQPNGEPGAVHVDDVEFTAISPSTSLGDYNADGMIDLADFTVWRDSLGATGVGLAADGDANGAVDQADYLHWRSRFGQSISPAGEQATVPEPGAVYTSLVTIMAVYSHRWFAR